MTLLFDGGKPDLVLAGINDGRNVGEDIAYSGTLAFGREAAFWGVPAICLSRVKGAVHDAGDDAALRGLLRTLWETRGEWTADGCWLAVNLPASLPAPIVRATTASAKIASESDVVERRGEQIRYRLRRRCAYVSTPGDENAAIDAGNIVIARHCWAQTTALPEPLVDSWNRTSS
jgi:5'-nucleotidase